MRGERGREEEELGVPTQALGAGPAVAEPRNYGAAQF